MFVLRELPHTNIVQYLGGFIDEQAQTASLYLEHCDMGNLMDFTNKKIRTGFAFREETVWSIFMQLVNAVAFMQYGVQDACMDSGVPQHWIGVVHRDIKPENIFLCSMPGTRQFRLVLGDFGQAIREDDDGNWGRQYLAGNQGTAPPEVRYGGLDQYSYHSDAWAVGWCMSAVCNMSTDPQHLRGAGPSYSGSLNRAIRRLMQADPAKRPLMYDFAKQMLMWKGEGEMEGMHRRSTW